MRKTRAATLGVASGVVVALVAMFALGPAAGTSSRFTAHDVKVFFTRASSIDDDCSETRAYARRTIGPDVLHDSMSALLRGPIGDEKDHAASMFSVKTAGMLNRVSIVDGVARIDFDDFRRIIPGASSSCGSASLLAELNRTAKQFASVDRAVYSFEGSVDAFYNWLQMDPPS